MEQLPGLRGIPAPPVRWYGRCGNLMGCPGIAWWLPAEGSPYQASREWNSAFAWKPRAFASTAVVSVWSTMNSSFPIFAGARFANASLPSVRLANATRNDPSSHQWVIVRVSVVLAL